MGLIAAALTCESIDEYPAAMQRAKESGADLYEFRLDFLNSEDWRRLPEIYKLAKRPIITTPMAKYEGGKFPGNEEERLSLFYSTLEHSDHITIEKQALQPTLKDGSVNLYIREFEKLLTDAKNLYVKVIVGDHDFNRTPQTKDEIIATINKEEKLGADIAKVAYMAGNVDDVNRILSVYKQEFDIPVIALPMGKYEVGRLLAYLFGSPINYGSIGKPSAPGQIQIWIMKKLLFDIDFTTRLLAIYENPDLPIAENLKIASDFMKSKIESLYETVSLSHKQ